MNETPYVGYFSGSVDELRSVVPEKVIDDACIIFGVDPNLNTNSWLPEYTYLVSLKQRLWDDISYTIRSWSKPYTEETEDTPKKRHKLAEEDRRIIEKCLCRVKAMHYSHLYDQKGTAHREYIVRDKYRRQGDEEFEKIKHVYGNGHALSVFRKTGSWPQLYPFDQHLETSIKSLETLLKYTQKVEQELKKEVSSCHSKGAINENISDKLVIQLSRIYTRYSGNMPKSNRTGSSAANPNQVYGKIIDFLELVLPYTSYKRSISRQALHDIIKKLKSDGTEFDIDGAYGKIKKSDIPDYTD